MAAGVATVWVPVDQMERAVRFYGEILGFSVTMQSEDWSEVDAGGLTIGLNAREGGNHADGGAVITFEPEGGLEAEKDRLTEAGVDFPTAISEHPWGRIVSFKDSEGNDLQLYAAPQQ